MSWSGSGSELVFRSAMAAAAAVVLVVVMVTVGLADSARVPSAAGASVGF